MKTLSILLFTSIAILFGASCYLNIETHQTLNKFEELYKGHKELLNTNKDKMSNLNKKLDLANAYSHAKSGKVVKLVVNGASTPKMDPINVFLVDSKGNEHKVGIYNFLVRRHASFFIYLTAGLNELPEAPVDVRLRSNLGVSYDSISITMDN